MFALIDVGNTNIVFGFAKAEQRELVASLRFSTTKDRTADDWYGVFQPSIARLFPNLPVIEGLILSSVVPVVTSAMVEMSRRHFGIEPIVVGPNLELGITIEVDAPAEVGTDRLVNCAYAFAAFGGPSIVIDMGTATKIEAISAGGAFLGGVIAPGIALSLDTLAHRAARLYAVELRPATHAIGRNTIAAVQAGVVNGHIAMIEGMVAQIANELGSPHHVILTGGHGALLADWFSCVTVYEPNLTLLGLRQVYLANRAAPS